MEDIGRAHTASAANTCRLIIKRCLIRGGRSQSQLVPILLPLLFILLLPSIRIERRDATPQTAASQLLLGLLRLPLDQVRLGAGLVGLASGASRQQLLAPDEETHLQLIGGSPLQAHLNHFGGPLPVTPDRHQTAVFVAPGAGLEPGEQLAAASEYGPAAASMGSPDGGGGQLDAGGGDPSANGLQTVGGQTDAAAGGASSSAVMQARVDLPAIRALNVKCEKNYMTVNIVFDRPFYGTVFSKGHYNDQQCVHLPANTGQSSINFDIHLGKCGMTKSDASGQQLMQPYQQQQQQQQVAGGPQQPNGLYIENTIVIQYDPQVQEIYDQARRLRCTWYDYYEKSVTFRPYNVDMLDAVTANFLGDNIQCWMQIQVGKGPWSSEVAGIVKIGQTMTMVLAIKDDDNKFDMLVRNCVAHDGKHQPIQLVDEYGCVARPKIMARFQKVRNFGPTATVVSYAHFQAFKFPDSMSVHFQCVIQVCRSECPEPVCSGQSAAAAGSGGDLNSAPGAPNSADYATSGTEIMPSKEMLPGGGGGFFLTNHSHLPAGMVQVKSMQEGAQVKLDTSMMAGGRQRHAQQGALPPHLLHSAASNAEPLGYLQPAGANAAFYKGLTGGGGQARIVSSSLLPSQSAPASASVLMRPPQQQQVAPASARFQAHFSPPYSHLRPTSKQQHHLFQQRSSVAQATDSELLEDSPASGPEEAQPLSLIAKPRGLRHRLKRSVEAPSEVMVNDTGARSSRNERSPDSTAVRTQKTIQVVSPDDVAFSLDYPSTAAQRELIDSTTGAPPSLVCFSMARLVVSGCVTVAALALTILIVCYVLLRQRILTFGCETGLQSCAFSASAADCQNQQLMLAANCRQLEPPIMGGGHTKCSAATGNLLSPASQQHLRHQQQDNEIQQRNKYMSRLYSQFVPAAHWR